MFGQYTFEKRIGSGTYGSVSLYKTKEGISPTEHVPQRVAVKEVVNRNISSLREADILSQLSHPNLVTCFGVEHSNTIIYIKMEVANCNLAQFQAHFIRGPILSYNFIYLANHLAQGLKCLHENNIAHRDIKPQNILAFWNQFPFNIKNVILKYCDFGCSRYIPEDSISMSVVGTQSYFAPEVYFAMVQGSSFQGDYLKVDIFSLGLVMLQMLLNDLPYDPKEFWETKKSIITPHISQSSRLSELLKLMLAFESIERITAGCMTNMISAWHRVAVLEDEVIELKNSNDLKDHQIAHLQQELAKPIENKVDPNLQSAQYHQFGTQSFQIQQHRPAQGQVPIRVQSHPQHQQQHCAGALALQQLEQMGRQHQELRQQQLQQRKQQLQGAQTTDWFKEWLEQAGQQMQQQAQQRKQRLQGTQTQDWWTELSGSEKKKQHK